MTQFARTAGVRFLFTLALAVLPAKAFAAADIAKLTTDATAGVADAQFQLANAYMKGDGVGMDIAEGVKWCRLAAEQGYAPAQTQLAMKYANGNGVPVDHIEADKWITLAVRADKHYQSIQYMVESHFTFDEIHGGHVAADQWQADHKAGK